jgi:hypothetical protein
MLTWPKMQCFLVMWNRVERVFQCVKEDLQNGNFVSRFRLSKLRDVLEKTRELTEQLGHEETPDRRTKAEAALGLLFEVVRDDFIPNDLRLILYS